MGEKSLNFVGTEGNFEKLEEGETVDHLGTSYDYGSVLHYSETAFAVDPSEPTIETINPPGAEIGQREVMSALDSERVQILYGCLAIVSSAAAAVNFTLLIAGDVNTTRAYQTPHSAGVYNQLQSKI